MTLGHGFPGHSALATFADVRRDLEGAVARNAAGVMRAGIFPAHYDPLVTGRTDMKVNIADFRAVQNRGGAIFLANVGTDASVQLDAAPAANRRIDLIYVTQRSTALGDAASTPVFGVVKGTASASPVVPALPAAVTDAIRLATVEIPAGATTTLSAGVVITQVYPYTAMAGGTVVVRNSVELAAWTPADNARAFNLADTGDYVRVGGAWGKKSEPFRMLLTPTITGGGNTSGWYYANDSSYNFPGGTFSVAPRVKLTPRGTGFIVAQLAAITAAGITYGVARLGAAPAANTRVELEAWVE
ncbi:MAG: hypothetical protein D3X82_16925 [Candidatus Leucobacter sulfamidivorax]|nr:hypothetical protein [Candidatus Leucobacter sulfamidivorax]